jgi:hypothetical protein
MPGLLRRQGDLLIADIEELPAGAKAVEGLVLVEGQATGHQHRILEENRARLFRMGTDLFVDVHGSKASLVHPEHDAIVLGKGLYRVWRQREFFDKAIRPVVD